MEYLGIILTFVVIVLFVLVIYGIGYNNGENKTKIYFIASIHRILNIAVNENWTEKEVNEKLDDFISGRNPNSYCVSKNCTPVGSEDCIDCGCNMYSERPITIKHVLHDAKSK